MGSGWVWRTVTWTTIGCCVILKVSLGEHNGPFRVHPVPRSSSLAPGSALFCSGGQLHGSVCLPLPFDWPGMLERGMSTDCFKQNLASYQLGGLFIGGEAGQSQQREPGANSGWGNVQGQSSKEEQASMQHLQATVKYYK